MTSYPVHVVFPGRLIFVGFGSIGQGVLPLKNAPYSHQSVSLAVTKTRAGVSTAAATARCPAPLTKL